MKPLDAKAVGRRIKEAREKRGLTQQSLADTIDMSPSHLGVIERGGKVPNLDTFVLIANALHVSADSLLLDVVEQSTAGASAELTELLAQVPMEERSKIVKVVRTMIEA